MNAKSTATPSSVDLYLDLLKRTLTRHVFGETYAPPKVPRAPLRRALLAGLQKALRAMRLEAVRRVPFDPKLRAEGRDWPPEAETMIGLARLDQLEHAVRTVVAEGIPGDLIETGVWRGGACIFMKGALSALGDTTRTVWVADSFRGLPPPDPARHPADEGDRHHTKAALRIGRELVEDNFRRYGLFDERVRFLEGWFKDTLAEAPIRSLAVLRLDGDMYGSTMDAIRPLYPKLSKGGFLVVDDYGAVPACRQAIEDYRKEQGITEPIHPIDWTGVYWRKER